MAAKYDLSSLAETNAVERTLGPTDAPIFVVDDSESERFFLMRAFRGSGIRNPVQFFESGAEVERYLEGAGKYSDRKLYPLPGIVFLDLQMPPPNGFEVLRWKESRGDLPRMLWVAMSNVNSVRTVNDAYTSGASTFLTKPLERGDIENLVGAFEEYWTRVALRGGV